MPLRHNHAGAAEGWAHAARNCSDTNAVDWCPCPTLCSCFRRAFGWDPHRHRGAGFVEGAQERANAAACRKYADPVSRSPSSLGGDADTGDASVDGFSAPDGNVSGSRVHDAGDVADGNRLEAAAGALNRVMFNPLVPSNLPIVAALGLTEGHAEGKEQITPEHVRQFGVYYFGKSREDRHRLLNCKSPLLDWLHKARVALGPTARAPQGCFLLPRPGNHGFERYEKCVQWLGAQLEWHGAALITEAMVAKFEDADRNKDGADGAALASILSTADDGLPYVALLREKAAELASSRVQGDAAQPVAEAGPAKRHRSEADRR